jgi:hypothetical protein
MGVREARCGLRLPGEPLANILLEGELGRKNLDRYPALEAFIPGTIDHTHPTSTNLPLNSVGGTESFGETCGKRSVAGHGKQSVPALGERQPNPSLPHTCRTGAAGRDRSLALTNHVDRGQFGREDPVRNCGEPRIVLYEPPN